MSKHVVYLIHMDKPYKHAQHYLGYTENLQQREVSHENGNGSPLLRAAGDDGILFGVVRTWDCDCSLGWSGTWCDTEKRLKRRRNGRKLCPLCQGERR